MPAASPDSQAPDETTLAALRTKIGNLPDPEIPVVTLADLGIFRGLDWQGGRLLARLTPTYSGCPATEAIADDVRAVLREGGFECAEVRIDLAPAWTTDWISAPAREKLRAWGIAPPGQCGSGPQVAIVQMPSRGARRMPEAPHDPGPEACPHCGGSALESLSTHGSTPCKALYRCLTCREPFDYFKPI